jgi:hypothetical protein
VKGKIRNIMFRNVVVIKNNEKETAAARIDLRPCEEMDDMISVQSLLTFKNVNEISISDLKLSE